MKVTKYLKQSVKRIARKCGVSISRYDPTLEQDPLELVARVCPKARMVFDIGANIGQTASRMVKIFPEAKIFSFEPFPEAFAALKTAMSAHPRVMVENLAISDQNGTQKFYVNAGSVTNSLMKNSASIEEFSPAEWIKPAGVINVNAKTVEAFCAERQISRIDLLKVDTEGYDLNVLKGCGAMLTPAVIGAIYVEVLFVPIHEGQAWFYEVEAFCRQRGYRMHGLYEISLDLEHGYKWGNALFFPDRKS